MRRGTLSHEQGRSFSRNLCFYESRVYDSLIDIFTPPNSVREGSLGTGRRSNTLNLRSGIERDGLFPFSSLQPISTILTGWSVFDDLYLLFFPEVCVSSSKSHFSGYRTSDSRRNSKGGFLRNRTLLPVHPFSLDSSFWQHRPLIKLFEDENRCPRSSLHVLRLSCCFCTFTRHTKRSRRVGLRGTSPSTNLPLPTSDPRGRVGWKSEGSWRTVWSLLV